MLLLIIFAFLGGLVTILSPCILPVLPLVLSSSITGGKKRPLGVVVGFIGSFTFFTLFLSTIVKATGVSADALRYVAVAVTLFFGLTLILPKFQEFSEKLFSQLASRFQPKNTNSGDGFVSGIIVGLSLGLLWTPCVGPILAAIITLAATSTVGLSAVIITLAYAGGTALPLLAITAGGRQLLQKHPALLANAQKIQKGFGVLMIVTAIAILFSWDRQFQSFILTNFPSYGTGLTAIEDNQIVRDNLDKFKKGDTMVDKIIESNYGNAPEFIPGGEWINTKPLTMKELRGKVVLVDFWTYTCINCIRTLPYIKSWWEKYKDKGLVIVGVHTPEFEFEKNPDNVKKAINDFGITYPVMQDNNYATWEAYANHYWPAHYLIDKNGKIRNSHFGEGAYDETEQWIQKLLTETGETVNETISNPTYEVDTQTPETYLGYARLGNLASPESPRPNTPVNFTLPKSLDVNSFAYSGSWTLDDERAMPAAGSSLQYHFNASQVFLVMRPKTASTSVRVKVFLDDNMLTADNAGDDAVTSLVTVDTDRLYKLIKLPARGEHILKLEFSDDNVELYAFTFG